MPRPKKHSFIVEITDMKMGFSERRMKERLHAAINLGFKNLRELHNIANLKVKNYKRVMASKK